MPVVWESPVPIDAGPAQALAIYVVNKAGPYAERTIEKRVQKFTQDDVDTDFVVIWWIIVKRDWEDFKRRSKRKEARVMPMWVPSVMLFGDRVFKRIDRYQREEYDASEVVAARAELQSLVGFSAYAYFKHELW